MTATYPCSNCHKRFRRGGYKECPEYEAMLISGNNGCLSFEYDNMSLFRSNTKMDESLSVTIIDAIYQEALRELDDERRRELIDQEKERIKTRKPFLSRLFPWKITITRR